MQEVPAGEFKAHCLRLLDQVAHEGVELVVTKRGRPIARVVPLQPPPDLTGSVRVLVDDDTWFSTSDLVDTPSDLPA